MEEIKNLMETIQKENKNAIVVWSENTANGLSVSIQMNGKTESFMTMALHMICSIAVTMDVTPVEMLDTFKQLCADNPEAINDVMETLKRDLPADMPSQLKENFMLITGTKGDYYHKLVLNKILKEGTLDINPRPHYSDGLPAHTYSINHIMQQYDLSKGECPVETLRPIAWKSAVKEILWIYQMQSNKINDLHEMGIKYWDDWDIGDGTIGCRYGATIRRHNLMNKLLKGIKQDPFGRRHIMNMWQEDDFSDETGGTTKGLNPCCYETIWNVRQGEDGLYLDMLMNQRSSDYEVSCAINELQYIALQLMVAKTCGFKPGMFTHVIENVQIYDRHINNVKNLLTREPVKCCPQLILDTDKTDFYEFTIDDFALTDYPVDKIKEKNPQMKFDLGI